RSGVGPGVRRQPGWDIERDDGPAARVDQLDRARDAPFGGPARSRPEQRADDQVGARELFGRRSIIGEGPRSDAATRELRELAAGVAADLGRLVHQQHAGARAVTLEPTGHHEAVAAI